MNDTYEKLVDSAYNLHTSGKLEEAKCLYEKLLSFNPDDVNVLNLYAQLNTAIKNYDFALDIFNKIYEKTKLDSVLLNIAKVYIFKNDYNKAVTALDMLEKQTLQSLRILAQAYMKLNNIQDAINTYEKIMKEETPEFSDLFNLSVLYLQQEDIENSLKYALSAYSLNPQSIDINLQLASLYEKKSSLNEAINHLLNIAKIKVDTNILYRIGILYKKLNNDVKAVEYFNAILNIEPENKNALLNIALIYKNHDKNVSIKILNQLSEKFPDDCVILFYLYSVYESMLKMNECYETVKKLLKVQPDNAFNYTLAGDSLIALYKYDEAIAMYKKAVELQSEDTDYPNIQIAYLYSITGKVQEALELLKKYSENTEYTYIQCREKNLQKVRESFYKRHLVTQKDEELMKKAKRFFYKFGVDKQYNINEDVFSAFRPEKLNFVAPMMEQYTKKPWRGEDLAGKRLLIFQMHGAGDLIMMSRYIKQLQKMASEVIIQVNNTFIDLYKYNFPDIKIFPAKEILNESMYDCTVNYMCILSGLNIDLHNISGKPYLSVDSEAVSEKSELPELNTNKKKAGLYWQGNPTVFTNRSIKLEKFVPLFDVPDIRFYSFQMSAIDFESEELKKTLLLTDLTPHIKNYKDSAALLKNIDILITIDTSIAHLAGALGVKTYLLLPYATEWRWFYDDKTTPWYESIKIFKQTIPGDWDEVMLRVKNELQL